MAKKSDKKAERAQNIAPGQQPAATPAPNTTSGEAQAGDASDQKSASPDVASGQQHNPPASNTNQPGHGSDEQSPVPGGGKRGLNYQISVVSKPVTFRRAGMRFSRTPTVLNLGDLGDDQIQALIDEPNLTIKEVVDEKAD
jgi:hypothetical protein